MTEAVTPAPQEPASLAAARALLSSTPVFDGHNDFPWALRQAAHADPGLVDIAAPVPYTHTDLPRLAAGGVGAQFWSVYLPAELAGHPAVATTLAQLHLLHRLITQHPPPPRL